MTALAQATLFEALDRARVTVVAPIVGTGVLWTVVCAAAFLGRSELVGRRLQLREDLGEPPTQGRVPPQRLDVRPEHERELAVAPVEVPALRLEVQHAASRTPVPDPEAELVQDAELGIPLLRVAAPLPLAPAADVGEFRERSVHPVHRVAPHPETVGVGLRRHIRNAFVRARDVRGDAASHPVVRLVRCVLAAEELGEPVEQLPRQRLGPVGVVRVGDEPEHGPEIPRAHCHVVNSVTQIRISANTADVAGPRSSA